MAKISVIIPVYNVSEYLDKLFGTLLHQTFSDLEILVIDDGSEDGSYAICQRYAAEDDRIKLFRQSNSGPAAARNVGLNNATGDYIGFVDSDDWIEAGMYERLYGAAMRNGADVAICGYKIFKDGKYSESNQTKQSGFLSGDDYYRFYLDSIFSKNRIIKPFSCLKLFKREILADIRYCEDLRRTEDFLFLSYALKKCASAELIMDESLYIYRQSRDSITHNYIENYFDMVNIIYERMLDLAENNGLLKRRIDFMYVFRLRAAIISELYSKDPFSTKRKRIKSYFKHSNYKGILKRIGAAEMCRELGISAGLLYFRLSGVAYLYYAATVKH